MSARRINKAMRNTGTGGGSRVHYVRADFVSNNQNNQKQNERMVREAYRREKKMSSYLAEDENFPSFKNQLTKLGLELRDIPGDGNCLFRALGDQFEGHVRNHFRHRQDVVKYMVDNKQDFEPFLSEDTTFDRYIFTLQKMGTYAGNDAIVAFARLRQVNIIIHQLNSPFLLIQGPSLSVQKVRQLHIAYHNGDHYSSVRKAGDNTESPTNIRLKIDEEIEKKSPKSDYAGSIGEDEGLAWAVRDTSHLAEEVMNATGCTDEQKILESLHDCDYAVDATIAYVLQIMDTMNGFDSGSDSTSLASQLTSTDSGIWSENGATPTKVLGAESVSHRAQEVNGARSKTYVVPQAAEPPAKMTGKQTKKLKKMEKKKRAEVKHKLKIQGIDPQVNGIHDDDDMPVTIISKELQMAKI